MRSASFLPHNNFESDPLNGALHTGNLIFSARPELYSGNLSRGNPDLPRRIAYQYGTEKGKNILGVQYKSPEDTILSMAAYFETRGWLRK